MLEKVCEKCNGAVFTRREIDWEGNVVWSLRCWNGHIHSVRIEGIETGKEQKSVDWVGSKDDVIAYIGLFTHV